MSDTIEKRARETAHDAVRCEQSLPTMHIGIRDHTKLCDHYTNEIATALRAEYERGQKEAADRIAELEAKVDGARQDEDKNNVRCN